MCPESIAPDTSDTDRKRTDHPHSNRGRHRQPAWCKTKRWAQHRERSPRAVANGISRRRRRAAAASKQRRAVKHKLGSHHAPGTITARRRVRQRRRGGPESSLAHATTTGSGAHGTIDANEALPLHHQANTEAITQTDARPNHRETHEIPHTITDAKAGPHAQAHAKAFIGTNISAFHISTILRAYKSAHTGTHIPT